MCGKTMYDRVRNVDLKIMQGRKGNELNIINNSYKEQIL